MKNDYHHEPELLIPAIHVMRKAGGGCSTVHLVDGLKFGITLTDLDEEFLPATGCTRFEKIVSNIKTNQKLVRMGLAYEIPTGLELSKEGMVATDEEVAAMIATYSIDGYPLINETGRVYTNDLSLQAAMVKYVKDSGHKFVNAMEAAAAIRLRFNYLPTYLTDEKRVVGVGELVEAYIADNKHNVK